MDIKELNKSLDEGVNAMLQQQSFKELLDSVVETTAEKHGLDKSVVRKAISEKYKKIYNPEKYNKAKLMIEEVYDIVEGGE